MNVLCIILLFLHSLFYISFVLFFLLIVFLIFYIIRNGTITKFIKHLTNNQIEKFQGQTEKYLSAVYEELKTHSLHAKETDKILLLLNNELYNLVVLLNSNNETNKTKSEEIISNLELLKQSNESLKESYEKIAVFLKNINIKRQQHPPIKSTSETNNADIKTNKIFMSDEAGDILYYLPFPDPKGFFWDDKKRTVLQSNSAYIMNLMKNNTKRAYFSLLTTDKKLMKNALLNKQAYLKPLCEISGNLSGHTISVIENGELELINNKWTVLEGKKMKIEIK